MCVCVCVGGEMVFSGFIAFFLKGGIGRCKSDRIRAT